MVNRTKFLKHIPLPEMLSEAEENRGQKQKVTRADPDTGISRQIEEWVEIKKDCSSPHMLGKAQSLRGTLWELEGLCSIREAALFHQKQMKLLEVEPDSGMRAPTCAEYLECDRKLLDKVHELYNYERISFATALATVMKPEHSELWNPLKQKVSVPNWIAVAAAAQGGRLASQALQDGGPQPKVQKTAHQRKQERQNEQKKKAANAAAAAKAARDGAGHPPPPQGIPGAGRNLPAHWQQDWAGSMKNPATGKETGFCHQFQAKGGCTRTKCPFLHYCPRLINGRVCGGKHKAANCSS